MQINTYQRYFTKPGQISEHLRCSICSDVFTEPRRLDCGHTYCESCLILCLEQKNQCPECREQINYKQFQKKGFPKDLIAYKIINDLEVYCHNKDQCNWKGRLSELVRHMRTCKPCDDEFSRILGTYQTDQQKREQFSIEEDQDEEIQDHINENVPRQGLFQRLLLQGKLTNLKQAEQKKEPRRDSLSEIDNFLNEESSEDPNTQNKTRQSRQAPLSSQRLQEITEEHDKQPDEESQKSKQFQENSDLNNTQNWNQDNSNFQYDAQQETNVDIKLLQQQLEEEELKEVEDQKKSSKGSKKGRKKESKKDIVETKFIKRIKDSQVGGVCPDGQYYQLEPKTTAE